MDIYDIQRSIGFAFVALAFIVAGCDDELNPGDADADSDGDGDGDSDADSDGDTDADSDGDADGDPTQPAAHAGENQLVDPGATVTLDGTGSTHAISFDWEQIEGSGVEIADASSSIATFVAPTTPGEMNFRLTVTSGSMTDSDTTRVTVRASTDDPISWTHGGFDIEVVGAVASGTWDPYTEGRYLLVPVGERVSFTVVRNDEMKNVSGDLDPAGNTRVHIGYMEIQGVQMWSPDADQGSYDALGSFIYTEPFASDPIDSVYPLQIWNEHPGMTFLETSWQEFGSNAIQVWLIPETLSPGNIAPVPYSNGTLSAGELEDAPPGAYPPLYRDAADEERLHAALEKIVSAEVFGVHPPYDIRGSGNYWDGLSHGAALNALLGWHLDSEEHLEEARAQLLAIFAVHIFGHETAAWWRARTNPSADLLTTYGREVVDAWFQALVAACALGPNMANVLEPEEFEAINAHLYRSAIHDVYASFNDNNYYTSNGGINLHFHPVSVVAGWNWGIPDAVNVSSALSSPSHNACNYYFDSEGVGQYALSYCEESDPSLMSYEHVGNSQAARYWVRFGELFSELVEIEAMQSYVEESYAGQTNESVRSTLEILFDDWLPM